MYIYSVTGQVIYDYIETHWIFSDICEGFWGL